jgi:hypothetical protein
MRSATPPNGQSRDKSAQRNLPEAALADVDGVEESRRGTVSVFDGPPPKIELCHDQQAEVTHVGGWIGDRL